jgi:Secretory pathway protein Sec39
MPSSTLPNPLGLSEAAVLLLAANLTSLPHLGSLQDLISAYPNVLHFSALLQIFLNVLPETISPEDYLPLVYKSYHDEPQPPQFDPSRIPTMYIDQVSSLSHSALRRKLALFGLSDIPEPPIQPDRYETTLGKWFFDRAHKVEEATGMIDLARRVVLPDPKSFGQSPPFPPTAVTLWAKGIVQVLETFIFDNDDEDELRLLSFENLDPESAVRLLLSRSTPEIIQRNVRHLLTPFAAYVTTGFPKMDPWLALWEWLLDRSSAGELDYIATLGNDWVAGEDLTRQFLKTNLTACYLCQHSSPAVRSHLHRIHSNVSRLSQSLGVPSTGQQIVFPHLETDLLSWEVRNSSPLTTLTVEAIVFLDTMIMSADIIAQSAIKPEPCLRDMVLIRDRPEQQFQLLDQLLRTDEMWTKRNAEQWTKIRLSILWLQSQSGVLGKLPSQKIDVAIFTAILDATSAHPSAEFAHCRF